MYCRNCGLSVNNAETVCPNCEAPTAKDEPSGRLMAPTLLMVGDTPSVDMSASTHTTISYQALSGSPSEQSDPLIGRTLAGRYRLLERLGEGGMGLVYKAEHVKMSRVTAIKVLVSELASNADFVARFQGEARMASHINHPNAVAIYDFGEAEDGLVYLAMEFVDGEPLSAIIEREYLLPLAVVVSITRQAAEALHAAHQLGIVHRDFKPANVMICRRAGKSDLVKVLDFGIAKQVRKDAGHTTLTKEGVILGTPLYMSPEQVTNGLLDGRSDLYSLALVVYQMLTGQLPFRGGTLQEQMVRRLMDAPLPMRDISPQLELLPAVEPVILKALSRNADERHSSALEFAMELEHAACPVPGTNQPSHVSPDPGALLLSSNHHGQRPFTSSAVSRRDTGEVGAASAPVPAYSQSARATQPQMEPPSTPGSRGVSASAPVTGGRSKALIAIISAVAVVAIALAVYLALESSPTAKLATALRIAVNNGKLVALSNDDAYSYYYQLRGLDPSNKALAEVGPKVLPQLRSIGEEIFRKKMAVTSQKDTTEDWQKTLRIYEWAHTLEPSDKQLEARWRFSEGEVAKLQLRKDDAERGYSLAAQVNSSWALPQSSLGLLRSESKRWSDAIPYFQRAIDLQSNWEVPYNNMGTAYFFLKNYDAAESWYRIAIEKNPTWGRPHYWLGTIYEQKKWKPQAIEEYQTALNLSHDNSSLNTDEILRRIAKLRGE